MFDSDESTKESPSASQSIHPSANSNNGIGEGGFFHYEEAKVAVSPISPLLVFRKFRAFGLQPNLNINEDPVDHLINPTSGTKNLEYANGNWSTFQYIGEDKILSIGGCVVDSHDHPFAHENILEIDLITYSPMIANKLRSPKFAPCVALVDGAVYIFGGGKKSGDLKEFSDTYTEADQYDPVFQLISPLADMPHPKRTMNPAHHENRIYFIGGLGSKESFLYNIDSNDYTALSVTYPSNNFHSLLLVTGNELVVLGDKKMRVYKLSKSNPEQIGLIEEKVQPGLDLVRSSVNPRELESKVCFLSYVVREECPGGRIWNCFATFDKASKKVSFGKVFRMCEDVNKAPTNN